MYHWRLLLVTGAAGISMAVAGCSDDADTSADTQVPANQAPANDPATVPMSSSEPLAADSPGAMFLTQAMMGDNSEIALGQMAIEKGSTAGVRDFGQMLVDEHRRAATQSKQIASAHGVATTEEMTPEARAQRDKLMGLSGAEFDAEFVRFMVEEHQKVIAKFEEESNSTDPAPITDHAGETLPALRRHLEMAQSLATET